MVVFYKKCFQKILTVLFLPFSLYLVSEMFLVACNRNRHPAELKVIDSLMVVADSNNSMIAKITSDEAVSYYNRITTDFDSLKKLLSFPELPKEELNMITQYYSLKKTFQTYSSNYQRFTDEAAYSKKQLQNLKHDIEKNLLTKEKIKEYLVSERQSVHIFQTITGITVKECSSARKKFLELSPQVEKIINDCSMQSQGKSVQ